MVCKVSFLVVSFLLFAAFSYAISVEELNTICRQTTNPSFCFALLNSHHSKNLISLTQYTIEIARANVTNTIKVINSLITQSKKNAEAQNHYTLCLEHFSSNGGALTLIDYTKQVLKNHDYEGVNVAASAILTNVDNCIYGDSPSDPLYKDTSILPHYVATIEVVIQIILVISNKLLH
ncbi:hypothetical protein VNO77_34641 [Canavalia gladiata]|uniref:Pectinesterase inhibitor domain-containing protein n=1 Tax=Canavalia gladiata TaxID=3824 RepID=A0AAN9PZD4_CANGL